MKLGIIGAGAMAATLLEGLQHTNAKLDGIVCLSSTRSIAAAKAKLAAYVWPSVVSDKLNDLLKEAPDFVVEAAGQEAVRLYGAEILKNGMDLGITSVGALTDDHLYESLLAAARSSGAQLHILPGAVGGVDILAAARASGLDEVIYTSRKPPSAWKQTQAETLIDLDHLTEPFTFFTGSARLASSGYPKNANVAATIALAGLGLDKTTVCLVADPTIEKNIHELSFTAGCANASIRIEGNPSPDNPKTSQTAGYSLVRFVLNHINQEVV